jgi:hypothetical protein
MFSEVFDPNLRVTSTLKKKKLTLSLETSKIKWITLIG